MHLATWRRAHVALLDILVATRRRMHVALSDVRVATRCSLQVAMQKVAVLVHEQLMLKDTRCLYVRMLFYNTIHGHRTLKAPHPVRSAQLTRVPPS